jgi:hypothetical protein
MNFELNLSPVISEPFWAITKHPFFGKNFLLIGCFGALIIFSRFWVKFAKFIGLPQYEF